MMQRYELTEGRYYRNAKNVLGRWSNVKERFLCVKTPNLRRYADFQPEFRVITDKTISELSFFVDEGVKKSLALTLQNKELVERLAVAELKLRQYDAMLGVELSENMDVRELAWRTTDGSGKPVMLKVKTISPSRLVHITTDLRNQIMSERLRTGNTSLSFLTLRVMENELARRKKDVRSAARCENLYPV
jgi:hypothetical protein